MFKGDTDVLFPSRLVPQLAALDLPAWRSLLERLDAAPPTSPEQIAFTLFMTRLCGCESCQLDSYRGVRGCSACAVQTIQRTTQTSQELQIQFEQALGEVLQFLQKTGSPQ